MTPLPLRHVLQLRSTLALLLATAPLTTTVVNMVPDYEVKLLLSPAAVLGADKKLTPTVRSVFDMPKSVTKMNVQFLDTDDRDIYNAGWSPRIRKTEGDDDFELTYKKRYPVTAGDIDAALTTAGAGGFDATETSYAAQVEWGFRNQTLSLSHKKSASGAGHSGMDLPGLDKSRAFLKDNAPGKFDGWQGRHWGTGMLGHSRVYGPVLARRWVGKWAGLEVYIEVWPIRDAAGTGIEYVVEASFKTPSHATAAAKQAEFVAFLGGKEWLLAQDSLKTQLIMDRY